jgi:superoxide dismutase, Cu-Zn family
MIAAAALPAFANPATASASVKNGAQHATAEIRNGAGGLAGWAKFTEDGTGVVHVNVHVNGLAPGLHGTHVHAVGLCEGPLFTSAGSHYNPSGASHGAHAGDLPNLAVNRAGVGHLNSTTDFTSLSALAGRALIIHAGEDDLVTNPTGNSGGRVGCGIITLQ